MTSFLPDGYEVPASGGSFMKFEQGDNKFRILDSPALGQQGWTIKDGKKKPVVLRTGEEFAIEIDGTPNHYWGVPVWNYQTSNVAILEITQKGIQGAIVSCSNNSDWGDPRNYDFVVNKTGSGKDGTKYTTTPVPPKELTAEILEAIKDTPYYLDNLFTGDHPFKEIPRAHVKETTPDDLDF